MAHISDLMLTTSHAQRCHNRHSSRLFQSCTTLSQHSSQLFQSCTTLSKNSSQLSKSCTTLSQHSSQLFQSCTTLLQQTVLSYSLSDYYVNLTMHHQTQFSDRHPEITLLSSQHTTAWEVSKRHRHFVSRTHICKDKTSIRTAGRTKKGSTEMNHKGVPSQIVSTMGHNRYKLDLQIRSSKYRTERVSSSNKVLPKHVRHKGSDLTHHV